ncbi:MAG: MYG1 family protein [Patescibacteria group bacterium]|jgi:uncharacterized UPF0160 family protein
MIEKEHKVVATHNGRFHADDVFACAALALLFIIQIFRTRDQEVYEKADFRVDVGGENDPNTGDFDHHMFGGAGIREGFFKVLRFAWIFKHIINLLMWKLFGKKVTAHLPYASFGLVWKKFGVAICDGNEKVAKLVEKWLVIPIDAQDNGYKIFQGKVEDISAHTISNVIDNYNPAWDENDRDPDVAFFEALEFAKVYLKRTIARAAGVIRAEELVLKAVPESDDPRIVVLNDPMPWSSVVKELPLIKFVVHRVNNGWMVHVVNAGYGTGKRYRKNLPKAWHGQRGSTLVKLTGVADADNCHKDGHIVVAKSREGAIALAKVALKA